MQLTVKPGWPAWAGVPPPRPSNRRVPQAMDLLQEREMDQHIENAV